MSTTPTSPAPIAAAEAAARAARAWSDTVPPPADLPEQIVAPAGGYTVCSRPPTAQETEAVRQRRHEEQLRQEIDRYAGRLLVAAWRAAEPENPDVPNCPPSVVLSPEALARAHGVIRTSWRTSQWSGQRAYVCLDCGWAGTPHSLFRDSESAAAQAAAHQCVGGDA